ncbi:hypothetical protein FRX31_011451 [Thalictrum thalictroides]|uniref:Uncharacterized protein n=1 Tax=Thalictrum thalictroides TaxID=46969 RepID=A0A7J6WNK2_THATH|nr:hypothetical protein FRX31_011451 [Thalictrum thalictroides]
MQWASKAMDTVMRASNNNIVINTFLIGTFTALSIRSLNQQRDIETLETEKNSLLKTNKDMMKSMWEWKQQLFAEAGVEGSPVSLSKLKTIYGEATIDPQGLGGAPVSEVAKPPPTNFVV